MIMSVKMWLLYFLIKPSLWGFMWAQTHTSHAMFLSSNRRFDEDDRAEWSKTKLANV